MECHAPEKKADKVPALRVAVGVDGKMDWGTLNRLAGNCVRE